MYRPRHRPAQFETSLTVNHTAFTVHWLAFLLRPCERASEVAPPFAHARIDHEGIRFRRNLLQQASDRAERNFQNDAECRALTRRTERMVQFLRRSGFPSRDSVTGLGHDVAVDRNARRAVETIKWHPQRMLHPRVFHRGAYGSHRCPA